MFFLDSLMISGISWTLETIATAADAELNDDTTLREQLLAAEMQRENGEISDEDYAEVERELLRRIREIRERRSGGAGPIAFADREALDATEEARVSVEAVVSGDFHQSADAPHTTVVEMEQTRGGIVGTESGSTTAILDVKSVRAETRERPGLPLPGDRTRKVAARGKRHPPKTTRKTPNPARARTSSLRSKMRRP